MTVLKEQRSSTGVESKTLAFIGRLTVRQLKNHQAQGLRNTVKQSDLAESLSAFPHQYTQFHTNTHNSIQLTYTASLKKSTLSQLLWVEIRYQ